MFVYMLMWVCVTQREVAPGGGNPFYFKENIIFCCLCLFAVELLSGDSSLYPSSIAYLFMYCQLQKSFNPSWFWSTKPGVDFFSIFFLLLGGGVYVAAPIINGCDEPMGERGRKKQGWGRKGSIASKSWMGVTPWSSTQGAPHEPHFTAHSQYHMVACQEREK